MLGPCLIAHGSDEQKTRYLGPMLHGDEVWCQMFSEPAAGSDLAAVQMRAVVQDDGSFVLNGQKVWTTNAQFSAYGLVLARTNVDIPKHKGMTMFIVPMDAPGVTVRGLRQISGEAEFNEVFLDDVRIPAENVVGGVDNGWGTALTVLMFERLTIGLGSEGFGYNAARFAAALSSDPVAAKDKAVRKALGEIGTDLLALRFASYRTLSALSQGQIPGPESGLAKVTTVNAAIAAGDLIADVVGPDALDEDNEWAYMISFLPGLKSAGGTEQILRNTIGERVLGLPPEPRLDKGIPFSELRRQGEGRGGRLMDLSLTDEQEFLREAARGTLSRFKIIEAAREAQDKGLGELPDLWPAAREAGWAGLLISEEHGGAGLDVFDAMLVAEETGRVLAPVPFLGLVPATAILDAAGYDGLAAIAAGEVRPVWIPTRPPGDLEPQWTVDGPGAARPAAPTISGEGDSVTVTGHAAYVVDAPGADLLVVTGVDGTVAVVDASAAGVTVEQVVRYDVTRSLAHVTLDRRARHAAGR